MQTLWTRVAQVRATCRCPQCLNAANGVTRRATASATRRMPKYLYSSTLWYSGIFAAAATFDASRKERRKEQWDRVIAEARQELEQPSMVKEWKKVEEEEDEVGTYEPALSVADGESIHHESEKYVPFSGLLEGEDRTTADVTWKPQPLEGLEGKEGIFKLLDPIQPRAQWPVNTGPELQEWDLPPQSVYAPEWAERRAQRTRWTPKKLATVEKCTELMQLQIIRVLKERGWGEQAAAAVPDEYARYIRQSKESLNREVAIKFDDLFDIKAANSQLSDFNPRHFGQGEKLCEYTQDALGNFHQTAREFNRSLRDLFTQRRQKQISQAAFLAKLAYTLHLSPVPPNIDTFNTLLIGLIHVHENRLARKVIINMAESHIRTNELSFVTQAEYYIKRNDADSFARMMERMRGRHGGFMLTRPNVRIGIGASATKLLRVEVVGRKGREERVIQLPTPNPMMFAAIIKGVLKFSGFEAALKVCKRMGKEGWGVCLAGFTALLKDCADRGDWISGTAIWRQIQRLKSKSLETRSVPEKIGIEAFSAMLRLCIACDQQEPFETIWRQAASAWRDSISKLVSLVQRDIELRHASKPVKRVGGKARLGSVNQKLGRAVVEDKHDTDGRFWAEFASSLAGQESDLAGDHRSEEDLESLLPMDMLDQANEALERLAVSSHQRTMFSQQQQLRPYPATHDMDDLDQIPDGRSYLVDEKSESAAEYPYDADQYLEPFLPPTTLNQAHEAPKRTKISLDQSTLLDEQQLLGTHRATPDLDEYELRERPMALGG